MARGMKLVRLPHEDTALDQMGEALGDNRPTAAKSAMKFFETRHAPQGVTQ